MKLIQFKKYYNNNYSLFSFTKMCYRGLRMLTLRQVLKMPCLTRAQVLSGASGLDFQVSSVTVTDVPDFFQWLRGNEFILTTGYAFQGNTESLGKIMYHLKESNVAGLGIKFNRFLSELPESVRIISDEVGVPIVSIPYESSWTDIINPIMTEIINLQAVQLEHSDKIRKRLIEQVLGQGGLGEIARILAEFVENPSAIINLASNQVFSSTTRKNSSDIEVISELYLTGEGESSIVIQQVPEISQIQGVRPRVVVPIEAVGVKTGYIIIFEKFRPFCSTDIIPLEQATIVSALEIEKMEAHRKAKRNLRHHLLRQILEEDQLPYQTAKLSFQEVGWELSEHYLVFAVDIDIEEQKSSKKLGKSIWEIYEYILRNCSRLFSSKVIIGLNGGRHLIFLQPVNPTTIIESVVDSFTRGLKSSLIQLTNEIAKETSINIGSGRFYSGYNGIPIAYKEALQALEIGTQIFGPNRVTHFSELGLYRILHHEGIRNELKLFFHEVLDPLMANKNENKELLETLQVFLETGGNYRLAAKKLFLHQNTIRYRIESIERLCNVNFKNENDRLNLAISLKLIPFFNSN
jgi:purine catabolism regulator